MNDAPSYAMNLTVGLAFMLSLATLFRLFQKHIDGRPLLESEPRRPVPWNFLAPLVMLAPLALALSAALNDERPCNPTTQVFTATSRATFIATGAPPGAAIGGATVSAAAINTARRMAAAKAVAPALWLQATMALAMALACYALLAAAFGATAHDLGLPRSWRQLRDDVLIGAAAWAASLAPIYMILFALNAVFEPTEQHPLIEELISDHSLGMMAAAALAAVIAAPVYEETAFRLVLQGWLERREMLSRPVETYEVEPAALDAAASGAEGEAAEGPAQRVVYRYALPGWTGVLVSSLLFGLAHYGHGVSPAPLVLLGIVLGYMYHKTHRIVPCIVCHFLFNAFTFVLLALQFASAR